MMPAPGGSRRSTHRATPVQNPHSPSKTRTSVGASSLITGYLPARPGPGGSAAPTAEQRAPPAPGPITQEVGADPEHHEGPHPEHPDAQSLEDLLEGLAGGKRRVPVPEGEDQVHRGEQAQAAQGHEHHAHGHHEPLEEVEGPVALPAHRRRWYRAAARRKRPLRSVRGGVPASAPGPITPRTETAG